MAVFVGPFRVPDGGPIRRFSGSLIQSPMREQTFPGSILLVDKLEQPPPPPPPAPTIDSRLPGDYPARFFGGDVPVARETVYTAYPNVWGYVIEVIFVNSGASARVARLWIGGRPREPGVTIPAGEPRRETVKWLIKPGEAVELEADGAGVTVEIEGIEEVRSP